MNPRPTGPRRIAHFARSALLFALGLPVAFASIQGCAEGGSNLTGGGGTGGDGGSGEGGQTGGMGGESANSSSSSASSSTTSSGMGGAGGGFTPPAGTADYPAETETNDNNALANPFKTNTKGFTASIYPVGDIDVFEVNVTTAGSALTVAISDGKGGCPAGLSAAVRVDGPNGLVAADNANCPQLNPQTAAALGNLPAGKYYVQVESSAFQVEPFYVVELALQAPICGNGVTQGVEQCDDGNTNAGDGCSATCTLEGNFITEVEPNQPLANANSLNGADGVFAAIMPVGDQDYFSFDITVPGSSVTLETGDGFMGCPAGFDSVLSLYSPTGTLVIADDQGGVDTCSQISPALYSEATNLAVGTYTARVEEFLNDETQSSYVLKIKITAPACGDGFVQVNEECDDGNTIAGDGCSATCKLEGNYLQETEQNDTAGTANSVTGYDGAFGAIQPVGDKDFFSFDVTIPGSSVRVEVSNGYGGCPNNFNSVLSLYDPANQLLVSDDNDGADSCSLISPLLDPQAANLPVGTYKVRVEEYLNDQTQGSYVLKVSVLPPGCGDFVRVDPEQCDDGNTVSGDGCSAMCMSESPWEIEPNDMQATATPLWSGTNLFKASITPVGDVDYFAFTLPAGKKPVIETHDITSATTCMGDTEITLYDVNGMQIAFDDESGPNSCSRIDSALYPAVNNLPAATYYVRVNEYGNNGAIASYQLDVIFQ